MVEISNKKIKYILIFFIGLLFSNCANQLAPGGGEIDIIPPEIIEVYPADGTTNFNDDHFELGFSEFVDKRSVKEAIFISPALEGQIELDWSGKYVRIYFPEALKQNTTYVVTIGTDILDFNNKNRMAESYNLNFSTGDQIDRKVVTGKIFDPKPEGVLIFAYKLSGDINPAEKKPDYISQTGNDGSFKLGGLAAGTYRIFAVRDEFRDLLFQAEQDRIGVPYSDIKLSETDTLHSGLNFFLSKADTVPPRILSSVMTDRNHMIINLSEEYDSTIIRADNFFIYDSTLQNRSDVLFAYKGNTKPTEMVLIINKNIPVENNVYLFADTLRDKLGNIYKSDFTLIILSDRPDTIAPSVVKTIPQANTDRADFLNQKFYFQFNDAFDSTLAKTGISFADTSGKDVPFNIDFIDDASFNVIPPGRLEPRKDYIIKIDFSKFIDAAGNKLDSVYQFRFKTITGMDFTGAMGSLLNVDNERNPILILEGIEEDKLIYRQRVFSNGTFNFERIQPGKYILWSFTDADSSGTYSYGWQFPFKPSEEFSFHPDTLNLRARWSQTDLKFWFK